VSSYRARRQKDGRIVLEPFVEIPADERWLYENKEALDSIKAGLTDAKAGRVTRMSFQEVPQAVADARCRWADQLGPAAGPKPLGAKERE
jgi:hypothetical protein